MKLLLINGSPRANDACGEAVRRAAERMSAAGAETGIFWPVKTENLACSGCGACRGAGMCVADPRAGEFLKTAAEYDTLLFFAPAGLLGLGIDGKNFLERIAGLNRRQEGRPLADKSAAGILIGRKSSRNAGQLAELLSKLGLPQPAEDDAAGQALYRLLKEENV